MKHFLVFVALIFSNQLVFAQDGGGDKRPPQVGAFLGRVLPSGIGGADEIFSLSGVRYSHPLGGKSGFADFGGFFGNSEGVNWKSLFLSISMHIPVETLIGHAGVGLDLTQYSTETSAAVTSGGGHFIGGVMSQIGGNVFARFDMKLNSKPGTSLFFGLGLVFELDSGNQNGN